MGDHMGDCSTNGSTMVVRYVCNLRREVREGRLRVIRIEDQCDILHHLYEYLAMINQNTSGCNWQYGNLLNL